MSAPKRNWSCERTTLATVEGREIARRHITDLILLAATPHPSIRASGQHSVQVFYFATKISS